MEISRRRDASIAFFSVMKGDLVESYHGELRRIYRRRLRS